jgi:hypothetical protein
MASILKSIFARKPKIKKILCLPRPLRQLIQDYLPYEEALLVYTYLENIPPKRPIFHLDQADFLSNLKKEEKSPTGHSTYYIEHKEGVRMTADYLRALFALDESYKFFYQCPNCKEYFLLEFDSNVKYCKGLNIKGWGLYTSTRYENYKLCYCRIPAMKEYFRKNREKVEIKRQTLTMHDDWWKEMYYYAAAGKEIKDSMF